LSDIPFLCHFLDDIHNNLNLNFSTDFKSILENNLHISLDNSINSNKRILILSRKLDYEVDVVTIELIRRGIDYVRLNLEDILHSFTITYSIEQKSDIDCQIKLHSNNTDLSNISVVWLRNFDYGIENFSIKNFHTAFIFQQWNSALEILYSRIKKPWINSLEATKNANNRVNQFTHAKNLGFVIPATLITNDPTKALNFYYENNKNIIVKALYHHNIEFQDSIYSVYTHKVSNADLSKFTDLKYAPSILQERLDKSSELRVTVVKDKVFPVKIELNPAISQWDDIHRYPISQLTKNYIHLESDTERRCISLIQSLGLDYGAIDFVMDKDNKLFFLEVNPTGDWLWVEKQTKLPITKAVVDLLERYST
jgi:glutathione synthase/RimK-type ligase-like ATP-grasp enzyme